MDIDKIVSFAEKYLREFILYIVSFFWKKGDEADDEKIFHDLNSGVIFAVFSAFVGAYLWNRHILHLSGKSDDLVGVLTDSLLRWISFGLVLYGLLRMVSVKVHILSPILSVLKVFSVAHLIAIYAAYLLIHTSWFFSTPSEFKRISENLSITAAYLIELLILWFYIPREIKAVDSGVSEPWRLNVAKYSFLLVITAVVLTPYAASKCDMNKCEATETGVSAVAAKSSPVAGAKAGPVAGGKSSPVAGGK